MSRQKVQLSITIDTDVMAFVEEFRGTTPRSTIINKILKQYRGTMLSHVPYTSMIVEARGNPVNLERFLKQVKKIRDVEIL